MRISNKMSLRELSKNVRWADPSILAIVATNLFTLILVFRGVWTLSEVMWVYWGQSVIIGVANFFRILSLKNYSTKGLTMNGSPVKASDGGKTAVAVFFLFHYGFFHFVYAIFLSVEMSVFEVIAKNQTYFLITIMGFAFSHFFSLLYNKREDFSNRKQNLGTMMFYPYMRIIPMHLTIIFGSIFSFLGVILFLILKTVADIGMHMVEHAIFRDNEEAFVIID